MWAAARAWYRNGGLDPEAAEVGGAAVGESAMTGLSALASDREPLIGPLPEPVEDQSFRAQLERAAEREAQR